MSELFLARFGTAPDGVWLAPGRANLMGEHTDYNDGFVLPFALGQHIVTAAARRGDGQLAVTSRQEKDADIQVEIADLAPGSVTGWGAYPAGVAWALREAGYPVPGASIAIDSDVPAGAGLSSSAALECATALALTELAGQPGSAPDGSISRRELAAIARRAENEFVGVPSGIMDQSASLLCQAGHLLLLDCRSLETAQVPFDPAPAGAQLLIVNTRARHELSDGEYGERRAECEEAARQLGVASLRDVASPAEVDRLTDPVLRRRARHVVSDNQRVLAVVELLRSGPAGAEAYREIGAAAEPGARVTAGRLRDLLAGGGRDGFRGGGRGRVRRTDDWRRVRRVGAGARGAGQPGHHGGERGIRPARLDRAGVSRGDAVGQCPAGGIGRGLAERVG